MEPIVFIHGYSAESKESDKASITSIYGTLPKALRDIYGSKSIVEINLGRYISLEDGVSVDDIARALDQALRTDFSHLLKKPFHVLVHSTGALVIRNWIRRFSPKPSPIRNLIYMAGANFGSGWAHIGKGQLAKWARMVFQAGTERGVQVLDALEIGADWTIDLHLELAQSDRSISEQYKVFEYIICGTQADASWFTAPIRYAKEDGSDGVVRVSASNLNFHYLKFAPNRKALALDWKTAYAGLQKHLNQSTKQEDFYEIQQSSRPGYKKRAEIPFAIPYQCAHSGDDMGVVTGSKPRAQVLRLLQSALEVKTKSQWNAQIAKYRAATEQTYATALEKEAPGWLQKLVDEPRAQYDPHAQLIFRVRDQHGRPVPHYDIFLNSGPKGSSGLSIGALFEDKHKNTLSPHILSFYLRTDSFDDDQNRWVPRVPQIKSVFLEVSAVEPETEEILYLPMRFEFDSKRLQEWIQPHRTTIIDVELLRLPSPEVFRLVTY